MSGLWPDPRRVRCPADLARELDLLRARAAAGSRKAKVSLEDLARRSHLPRSTLHSYITAQTPVPSEILDRIVIALGATPSEQREWNEAWYRAHADDHAPATPPIPPPPFGLPARIRGFVGRTSQLAVLDGLVADDPTTGLVIAAVCGGPGVGKTALALHWAHHVGERFPDGCLYLDLRGYDPDPPMPTADALAALLGVLAPDTEPPMATGVRMACYRSRLAGRRMLVLLDNALGTEQVRPLLPGTDSCMVVVTSRDDLAGLVARDGARRVDLDALPLSDAVRLLGTLLGDDRVTADLVAAADLADRCARLPLALRVASELAAARPSTALLDLAGDGDPLDWLAAGGDVRTDVRAVLSWSYHRLRAVDPLAAKAFRLLGRCNGADFTPDDVAIVTGTSLARQVIATLSHANLVRPLPCDRYRMHDLLRAYAAGLADDGMPTVSASASPVSIRTA